MQHHALLLALIPHFPHVGKRYTPFSALHQFFLTLPTENLGSNGAK
jgi:hypothetical protein